MEKESQPVDAQFDVLAKEWIQEQSDKEVVYDNEISDWNGLFFDLTVLERNEYGTLAPPYYRSRQVVGSELVDHWGKSNKLC